MGRPGGILGWSESKTNIDSCLSRESFIIAYFNIVSFRYAIGGKEGQSFLCVREAL